MGTIHALTPVMKVGATRSVWAVKTHPMAAAKCVLKDAPTATIATKEVMKRIWVARLTRWKMADGLFALVMETAPILTTTAWMVSATRNRKRALKRVIKRRTRRRRREKRSRRRERKRRKKRRKKGRRRERK